MLNAILDKLLTPIKISKNENKSPATPATKHLVIQTFYSSQNPNPDSGKNKKTSSPVPDLVIPDKALLDKQKEILLNQDQTRFLTIEQITLNGSTVLIGLTRHAHPILRGIFMFPHIVKYTNEWNVMKKQACCLNAGIAAFQPLYDIPCLKLHNPNEAECSYLVDHRALSRIKWLWHPSMGEPLNQR